MKSASDQCSIIVLSSVTIVIMTQSKIMWCRNDTTEDTNINRSTCLTYLDALSFVSSFCFLSLSNNKLRSKGLIPAILYGGKNPNQNISIQLKEVKNIKSGEQIKKQLFSGAAQKVGKRFRKHPKHVQKSSQTWPKNIPNISKKHLKIYRSITTSCVSSSRFIPPKFYQNRSSVALFRDH